MQKININRNEFLRVLQDGSTFACRNSTQHITNCVRITTHQGRIRIESSDTENHIKVYGVCLADTDDISFCVNAKELTSYLNLIRCETVCLKYDSTKKTLVICHDNGKLKTTVASASDFPEMKMCDVSEYHTLPAHIVANWLYTAQHFILYRNNGTALGGINLAVKDGEFRVVGADHALIYSSKCQLPECADFNIIIPRGGAKAVADMCSNTSEIEIAVASNALIIKNADFVIYVRLIEVKYPDVSKMAKLKGDKVFKVKAKEIKTAVQRILAQSDSNEKRLAIIFDTNALLLKYDNSVLGKDMEETVPCEGECLQNPIVVNIDFLSTLLGDCPDEDIVFYHSDNNRSPMFFESIGEEYQSWFLLGTMV